MAFCGVGASSVHWRVGTGAVAVTRFSLNATWSRSHPNSHQYRLAQHQCRARHSLNQQRGYRTVSSPTPEWKLGDGLPDKMKTWRDEVVSAKRKTWDLEQMEDMRPVYQLLTSAIVPRPIAFVSTLSADGQPNLAPFSYFSMVSHNPPMLSVSFSLSKRRPKDTRENILQTKEFTVSIISEPFVEAANVTSVESPASTDEWIISGLTKEPSSLVKPPFVRESAVAMECTLHSHQDISPQAGEDITTTIVLAYIKKVHVRESVLADDGLSVDPRKLQPVARLGGTTYARQLEGVELPRISWKSIKEEYRILSERNQQK